MVLRQIRNRRRRRARVETGKTTVAAKMQILHVYREQERVAKKIILKMLMKIYWIPLKIWQCKIVHLRVENGILRVRRASMRL